MIDEPKVFWLDAEVLIKIQNTIVTFVHKDEQKNCIAVVEASALVKANERIAELEANQAAIEKVYDTNQNVINLLRNIVEIYKMRIVSLRRALEYYANENNWYDVNRHEAGKPEMRMVIGSIDTTGPTWIGGYRARNILAADDKARGE